MGALRRLPVIPLLREGRALEGTMFWLLAVIAACAIGLAKGGLPAVGMLAVPILSLAVSPVVAAGLLLPVLVFSDIFGVWAYWRHYRWDVTKIALIGSTIGAGIGWAAASAVSEQFVRLLIGIIGTTFALNTLLRRTTDGPPQPPTWGRGTFWTTVAGFTSFVSHAGAPPWQVWVLPMRMSKLAFAGTTTVVFAFMNASKIVPYYFLGQLDGQNLRVAAIIMIPAVISVFVGYWLVRVLPDRVFFRIVIWALLVVSLKLIWDGLEL